jgi:hypothetical protein
MGATHFLTRRLKRVSTEMSLQVLAYNLKRVIRILGFAKTMRAMKLAGASTRTPTLFARKTRSRYLPARPPKATAPQNEHHPFGRFMRSYTASAGCRHINLQNRVDTWRRAVCVVRLGSPLFISEAPALDRT